MLKSGDTQTVKSAVPDELVILLDVDNTLLDNDRFGEDLTARLREDFGVEQSDRYWHILNTQRAELGYVDYLRALQDFRVDLQHEAKILGVGEFILDYPFEQRVYESAHTVIKHLGTLGTTAILSDGDAVLQPRKVRRAGLWDAFDGRVMIYVHKDVMLDDVQRRYPARHYAVVDDKLPLLTAMKKVLGERLTTVFVRQGHYAREHAHDTPEIAPDYTIDTLDALGQFSRRQLLTTTAGITANSAR